MFKSGHTLTSPHKKQSRTRVCAGCSRRACLATVPRGSDNDDAARAARGGLGLARGGGSVGPCKAKTCTPPAIWTPPGRSLASTDSRAALVRLACESSQVSPARQMRRGFVCVYVSAGRRELVLRMRPSCPRTCEAGPRMPQNKVLVRVPGSDPVAVG
mmetsp:Transcript_17047/g.54196  ORF Transcript_17047/g.54196 Transcript_17047/m.54196 type:complete len:158 (+) Transcript_17047:194-667(+)